MGCACLSEMYIFAHKATWCYKPEDNNLNDHHLENLKCHGSNSEEKGGRNYPKLLYSCKNISGITLV
jgi:hypothetical protein